MTDGRAQVVHGASSPDAAVGPGATDPSMIVLTGIPGDIPAVDVVRARIGAAGRDTQRAQVMHAPSSPDATAPTARAQVMHAPSRPHVRPDWGIRCPACLPDDAAALLAQVTAVTEQPAPTGVAAQRARWDRIRAAQRARTDGPPERVQVTYRGPSVLAATYRPPSPAQRARIADEQAQAAQAARALADVCPDGCLPDGCPDGPPERTLRPAFTAPRGACPATGCPHLTPCPPGHAPTYCQAPTQAPAGLAQGTLAQGPLRGAPEASGEALREAPAEASPEAPREAPLSAPTSAPGQAPHLSTPGPPSQSLLEALRADAQAQAPTQAPTQGPHRPLPEAPTQGPSQARPMQGPAPTPPHPTHPPHAQATHAHTCTPSQAAPQAAPSHAPSEAPLTPPLPAPTPAPAPLPSPPQPPAAQGPAQATHEPHEPAQAAQPCPMAPYATPAAQPGPAAQHQHPNQPTPLRAPTFSRSCTPRPGASASVTRVFPPSRWLASPVAHMAAGDVGERRVRAGRALRVARKNAARIRRQLPPRVRHLGPLSPALPTFRLMEG